VTRPGARSRGDSGGSQQSRLPRSQPRLKDENHKERGILQTGPPYCALIRTAEDFKTALHQANMYLNNLLSSGRQPQSPTTSVASSSSRQNPLQAEDPELDRTRITYMTKLTAILQRNLRVRYEMNTSEVVRACVRITLQHDLH
jgi:hypothetical protein